MVPSPVLSHISKKRRILNRIVPIYAKLTFTGFDIDRNIILTIKCRDQTQLDEYEADEFYNVFHLITNHIDRFYPGCEWMLPEILSPCPDGINLDGCVDLTMYY